MLQDELVNVLNAYLVYDSDQRKKFEHTPYLQLALKAEVASHSLRDTNQCFGWEGVSKVVDKLEEINHSTLVSLLKQMGDFLLIRHTFELMG